MSYEVHYHIDNNNNDNSNNNIIELTKDDLQ